MGVRRDRLTADGHRAADGPGASERTRVRRQLQGAYQEPTHAQAHAALDRLAKELEAVNVSAVRQLSEGQGGAAGATGGVRGG